MDLGLASKAALVTGSSRGIGRAIAEALAHEGARVCLAARTPEALHQVAAELRGRGATVAVVAGDVTSEAGARQAVEATVAAFGGFDVLVNNVGGSRGAGRFDETSAEQWREVVDANLMSAVHCSRHAVAWMKQHGGGAIVHISSLFGREYGPSASYVAAKSAVIALAKEMGLDLARHGIRVNSVAPGSILFPGGSWDKRQQEDPARIQAMLERELPFGRFGTPEEVAAAVVFLCSSKASWVTGACLPVDGGQGRAL